MRATTGAPSARRGVLPLLVVLVVAIGFSATGGATGSSGDPTAVASKQKCTKARWKCAPSRYHLSAGGVVVDPPDFKQTWSAEVDFRKYRASSGEVDYAQEGGAVTVSASATKEYADALSGCPTDVRYVVPEQKVKVPRRSLNRSDFLLFFDLSGGDKNEYFLITGVTTAPELSSIKASGTVSCPGDGRSAPFSYDYIGSNVVESLGKGRPGSSPLRGSASFGGDSVDWKLTAKK